MYYSLLRQYKILKLNNDRRSCNNNLSNGKST